MTLIETTYNPMPANPEAGFLKTPDGMSLRYARWRATKRPVKGTVLLLHGRAEFIEKLFETVFDLLELGFDVFTFDWRGQGGSSRMLKDNKRGYIDSFDQYIVDLDTCIEQVVLPDCPGPYYILAHSTGALVAMLAAPEFGNRIRRMVLCAPLLRLGKIPMSESMVWFLSATMTTFGFGENYLAGGAKPQDMRTFIGNRLTSDLDRFNRNRELARENPDLAIGGPTAAWIHAAIRAMEQIQDPEYYSQITIPTLMIAAGNDQVVSAVAAEELGHRMRSASTLTIVGARHELMQERDIVRAQFLSAFSSFVPGTEILE